MNQSLVSIATGLCAAPLCALAGFTLTASFLSSGGGGSDQTVAQGYVGLVGGTAVALVSSIAVGWVVRRTIPAQYLPYVLFADVVFLVVGIAAWRSFLAGDPVLEYAEGRGVLQIELRIPRAVVGRESIDAVVAIDFAGGSDLSDPHPERVRDDGDAVILPWETTPVRVHAWEISVFVRGQPVLFVLPLPRVPTGSATWSDWIRSSGKQTPTPPDEMTLRYRFLVIPHGQ